MRTTYRRNKSTTKYSIRFRYNGHIGDLVSGRFLKRNPIVLKDITNIVEASFKGHTTFISSLQENYIPVGGILKNKTGDGIRFPKYKKSSIRIKQYRMKNSSYIKLPIDEPTIYNEENRFGKNIKMKFLNETGSHILKNPIKLIVNNRGGINILRFRFADEIGANVAYQHNEVIIKYLNIHYLAIRKIGKVLTKEHRK